jgi:glycine/sarcosine N-methyltransferase
VSSKSETTTDFYDALAPMFDVMTDWRARLAAEGPFLRTVLEDARVARVLDAACGSGGHALALASWGYDVAGADASPGMIALARTKTDALRPAVRFLVSDLAGLPANLRATPSSEAHSSSSERQQKDEAQFDAVLCLGNSLPHLLDQDELVAAMQGMAGVLKPGGVFVTQNLNYDLRWRTQPRFFAAQGGRLDGQDVLVWRFADYDRSTGRIAFHIALFRKGESDWNVHVHTTPQRPLFQSDLRDALFRAGYGEAHAYGRMSVPFEPFDADQSGDLVVVARKQ